MSSGSNGLLEGLYRGRVLVVAGSDPSGGAGIQADIKTITALGGYAATAITALTVQNTKGVTDVMPIPVDFVSKQIEAVLSDVGADVVKTGMLHDAGVMQAIVNSLRAMRFKGAIIIDDLHLAGEIILKMGPKAVLFKGGHLPSDQLVDTLLTQDGEEMQIKSTRLDTRHTHGTGCTLASAIATGLAQGESLELAFSHAHAFVRNAIELAPGFGQGNGPLGHGEVCLSRMRK